MGTDELATFDMQKKEAMKSYRYRAAMQDGCQ
jgi:hypothetical protein